MTEATIKISEDVIRAAVTKTILEGIPTEKRDELLSKAIESLVAEKLPGYGKTRLQIEFDHAVQDVVREIIKEQVATERTRELVRDVVTAACERLFDQDRRDKLVDRMSSALCEAMFGDR